MITGGAPETPQPQPQPQYAPQPQPQYAPQPQPYPLEQPPSYYVPQPPRPRPIIPLFPRRVLFDTAVGAVSLLDSDYNTASRVWGFDGFRLLGQLALYTAFPIGRFVDIGFRTAYGFSGGGRAPSDQAELSLQTFDLNALFRLGYPLEHDSRWVATPAVQIEAGALGAWASLRGETQSAWMPRIAVLGAITMRGHWVGATVRVGYQRAIWSDAGGHGVSLGLDGVLFDFSLQVAL